MGACLHEVETLAFLKVKREAAGLTHERSRFAELASWFYKRSAVGGVDHVCLVFRGGGVSLREAMSARSPPPLFSRVVGVEQDSTGRSSSSSLSSSSPPSLVWSAQEVVEVARGLLEVRLCMLMNRLPIVPPPPPPSCRVPEKEVGGFGGGCK